MKAIQRFGTLLALSLLASCSDRSVTGPTNRPGKGVYSVSIQPSRLETRYGETACFTAAVDATEGVSREVVWRAKWVAIDGNGCFVAAELGEDTVTAVSVVDTMKFAKANVAILPPSEWPFGTILPVHFETYDGSGQVVHPDAAEAAFDAVRNREILMAITPYPFGNANFENPSIFVSNDGLRFTVPAGVTNPLVIPGTNGMVISGNAAVQSFLNSFPELADYRLSPAMTLADPGEPSPEPAANFSLQAAPPHRTGVAGGYLSDPDLLYDPTVGTFTYCFRQYIGADVIFCMESADRKVWSAPREFLRGPSAGILSPSFVLKDGTREMFFVDASPIGCNTWSARVKRLRVNGNPRWEDAEEVNLFQPGFVVWHIEVQRLVSLGKYLALYPAYLPGTSCGNGNLFLATSEDGMNWTTFPQPVAWPGIIPQFENGVYRSAFIYEPDGDLITVWLTGWRRDGRWSAGVVRYRFSELLTRLGQ